MLLWKRNFSHLLMLLIKIRTVATSLVSVDDTVGRINENCIMLLYVWIATLPTSMKDLGKSIMYALSRKDDSWSETQSC